MRGNIDRLAVVVDTQFHSRLKADHITIIAVLLHLLVAFAIFENQLLAAGIMLGLFGLLDALDGSLARLQNTASTVGILLDSVADRLKEIIVYSGVAYWLAVQHGPKASFLAVAALGGSFVVTFIKTKGEALAVSRGVHATPEQLNRYFAKGIMRYDVRVFALVIGLVSSYLTEVILIMILLTWATAANQLYLVGDYLKERRR